MTVASPQTWPGCARFTIPADHPALPGHFPARPIVPGVVILDEITRALGQALGAAVRVSGLASVKFLEPLAPGETCEVIFRQKGEGHVAFQAVHGSRLLVTGSLSYERAA